jgi:hypothetical protein
VTGAFSFPYENTSDPAGDALSCAGTTDTDPELTELLVPLVANRRALRDGIE